MVLPRDWKVIDTVTGEPYPVFQDDCI
eukprot:COSAG01_NODE_19668_length_996_cov_3.205128_1_plen_26_part_10